MLISRKKNKKNFFNRYTFFVVVMVGVFISLGARLYYLQVTKGEYYSAKASTKSYEEISISAPRGNITDKNGIALATNTHSYNVTYTETDANNKQFYTTMSKLFKILDENSETQTDSFPLKINPYRFEFSTSDAKAIQTLQLRFLMDRGFSDNIVKKDFKGKKASQLSTTEIAKLNSELLKLTPEEVYKQLMKTYQIDDNLKNIDPNYTVEESRRYMVVKDAVKMARYSSSKAIDISSNIKNNTALILWQQLSSLPGIDAEIDPLRTYPYGKLGSSVLGYIGKISTDDAEKYSEKGYDTNNDYVGASGIEAALESKLRGNNGQKVVQVNSQGKITNNLATKEAYPGNNVQLTIDANLQYSAEQALNNKLKELQSERTSGEDLNVTNATRGAAVVINVHTGGVLALVSLPGFNPNDFSNKNGLTDAQIQQYFNPDYVAMAKQQGVLTQSQIDNMFPVDSSSGKRIDKYDYFGKPLIDYATMSLLPSGSTFKPVTAVAGLESGVINGETTVYDDMYFHDGKGYNNVFKSDGAHGSVNVVSAIGVSSNPFFMTVAQLLRGKSGNDAIAKYAWQFGLGSDPNASSSNASTGIEISENFGQVYNSVSEKNNTASQFLLNIELDLKSGTSKLGKTLQVIDLYDRSTDSKTITKIKTQLKTGIKDEIKTGKNTCDYTELLKKLIASDTTTYVGRTFSDNDIKAVVSDINLQISSARGDIGLPHHIYESAIGQDMNAFTPLQIASYISTLANGGTRYKVHLVDKITDVDGKTVEQYNPVVLNTVSLSAETKSLISQGMNEVTSTNAGGQAGTAEAALGTFNNYIPTAGKTGTAEFAASDIQNAVGRSDYAWFVGYAPQTNPEIAVSVVMFDGGYGSDAAYVAKDIYESYFKTELQQKNYPFSNTDNLTVKPEN